MKKGNQKGNPSFSKCVNTHKLIPIMGIIFILLGFLQTEVISQTIITVGASGANYTTIETAYVTGIPSTISGSYIIELQTNYTPSSESFPITLAAKTGASSSNTITIRPASGVTSAFNITANVTSQTFTFSGADYVIIDGRPGGTGTNKFITIENSNTGTSGATTNAIQFISDATYNVIKYCTIKGSFTGSTAGSGAISFYTATTTGNDNNTIQYCDLTGGSSGRPYALIGANGTSLKENDGNLIEYNNFYDHFVDTLSSYAISIGQYNNSFIIRNNSFYETTTFAPHSAILIPTGAYSYTHISIGNLSYGYEITNNYFGGKSSECGGSAMEIDGSTAPVAAASYKAILLSLGSSGITSIQGNTIKNISIKSNSTSMFSGIYLSALSSGGSVNIGDVTGNVIGSSTGTASIMLTSYYTLANTSYGIYLSGAGTINASNNTIGSITASNNTPASYPSSIIAINSAATGTQTINNNNIGSASTSNSIYSTSNLTAALVQVVRGIICAGNLTSATISGNTISNLRNDYAGTTANCGTYGIGVSLAGNYTIINNSICYLYNANGNTSNTEQGSVVGIFNVATGSSGTEGQHITGNNINNLYNTHPTAGVQPVGLYFKGLADGKDYSSNIANNFIHSIYKSSSSTSATIIGIHIDNNTTTTTYNIYRNIFNNIISLGTGENDNCLIYGVYESNTAKKINNIYFNTLYIGGSPNGNLNTMAIYIAGTNTSNQRDIRNNIFVNARSRTGGTGKHYAAYFGNATGLTVNYNAYYVSGTGGTLGYYPSADKTAIPIVTGQDANSQNINPTFTDPDVNGNSAADFQPTNALLDGAGVTITGYTTDYSGYSRTNPPSIGGIEFDNPLPVKLAAFTYNINNRNVLLKWTTASETNNSGFDIERKEISGEWNKIGFLKGKGTTNTATNYSFEDAKVETGKYQYRLKQTDYNGNFEYYTLTGNVEIGLPAKYKLSQNYPNPFNPITKIDYELPFNSFVSLKIYDVSGKEILNVINENSKAGYYTVDINANTLSSGIYYYRFYALSQNNNFSETKKMVLIK